MTFNFLIRDSTGWGLLFFALVAIGVFTQLTKTSVSKSLPVLLRALLKAAPALFLAGLSWYLLHPNKLHSRGNSPLTPGTLFRNTDLWEIKTELDA